MGEETKEFIIKDKRIFSGEDKEPQESEPQESEKDEKIEPSAEEAEDKGSDDSGTTGEPQKDSTLPEINFATFIFSLNSSALMHLGVIEDPVSGKKVKNLPIAKQTIDILGMLDEKTRGNLTKDEENLLKNILHDLRLMYVKEK